MGIYVNTNISSMMVQRNLTSSTSALSDSIQRLSTGSRINKAADDAAGLAISETLKSQSRGAAQAAQNAQTGVNVLQTAEGDLSIIQDNLQRIRDLAVQAANGTNGSKEISAIQEEVTARLNEISRISHGSAFNQVRLLDGSSTTLTLQVGANSDPALNSITVGTPLKRSDATQLGLSVATIGTNFGSVTALKAYIDKVDTAINTVSTNRSQIGALQNRLDSTIKSLGIRNENLNASESRIRDTDVAKESATMTKNQILQQASTSLLSQANQAPKMALSLLGG